MEKSTKNLDDVFRGLSPSALSAVAGITALVGAIKGLTSFGNKIIDVSSQFEQTQKSLETVMQSAEKGKALFEDLRKFSFDTTFGVDELASASSQLLNVGVSSNVLKKDLKMLGDLAQGDKVKFQELTSIFAKVQSTGKATSMQLNQIALRGIPITQTLKDMGITGVASAEDLEKAFQKLTAEGGQFHDAMNNIIDTIEGKKGFISDTFKEVLVNFGKLSGFTDAYKDALDSVYNILDKVNNKLMEWNNNPVSKAIMQGVIRASLLAIVGVIVSSLIPALTTVVTLLSSIDPTVWIRLGIGALTGAVIGVTSAMRDFEDEMSGVKTIVQEAKDLINDLDLGDIDLKNAKKNQKKGTSSTEENTVVAITKLQQARIDLLGYEQILKDMQESRAQIYTPEELDLAQKNVDKAKKLVEAYEQIEKQEQTALENERLRDKYAKDNLERLKGQKEEFDKFRASLGKVASDNEQLNKLMESREEVQKKMNDLQANFNKEWFDYGDDGKKKKKLTLSEEEKRKFKEDMDNLNKQYEKLNIQINIANLSETEKTLQKLFSLDDKTASDLLGKNLSKWVEAGVNKQKATLQSVSSSYQLAGINSDYTEKDSVSAEVQTIKKQIEELAKVNVGGKYNEAITKLSSSLKGLQKNFIDAGGTLKQWDEILGNSAKTWEETISEMKEVAFDKLKNGDTSALGDAIGSTVAQAGMGAIQGTDVGNAIDGFTKGGIWGAIIEVVVGAFVKVASSIESFDKVMNPITTWLMELRPVLEIIFDTLAVAVDTVSVIFQAIGNIARLLKPITTLISKLLNVLNPIFKILFGFLVLLGKLGDIIMEVLKPVFDGLEWFATLLEAVFDVLFGWAEAEEEIDEEKQTELERLKELNEQYKNLSQAIAEQEEYYLKKRRELDVYNSNALLTTRVNDMILTPKGVFNTSPEDTIIAMKHPENLAGGKGVKVNFVVNNNASDQVSVSASQVDDGDGNSQILVSISKKVASDYYNGANGWDSAILGRVQRDRGRSVSR